MATGLTAELSVYTSQQTYATAATSTSFRGWSFSSYGRTAQYQPFTFEVLTAPAHESPNLGGCNCYVAPPCSTKGMCDIAGFNACVAEVKATCIDCWHEGIQCSICLNGPPALGGTGGLYGGLKWCCDQ